MVVLFWEVFWEVLLLGGGMPRARGASEGDSVTLLLFPLTTDRVTWYLAFPSMMV